MPRMPPRPREPIPSAAGVQACAAPASALCVSGELDIPFNSTTPLCGCPAEQRKLTRPHPDVTTEGDGATARSPGNSRWPTTRLPDRFDVSSPGPPAFTARLARRSLAECRTRRAPPWRPNAGRPACATPPRRAWHRLPQHPILPARSVDRDHHPVWTLMSHVTTQPGSATRPSAAPSRPSQGKQSGLVASKRRTSPGQAAPRPVAGQRRRAADARHHVRDEPSGTPGTGRSPSPSPAWRRQHRSLPVASRRSAPSRACRGSGSAC